MLQFNLDQLYVYKHKDKEQQDIFLNESRQKPVLVLAYPLKATDCGYPLTVCNLNPSEIENYADWKAIENSTYF